MNRINEIDNTMEGKEIKTYDQDHPELVVLSGRLYGEVTYVEYFDAYYLQFGDNVYYFPQKDSYQEGKNWKKKKFDSYEECLNFSQQHNIKIVMKSTVKSPFSNGLPDPRFLFPKRNTPYDPSERIDVSRIRENKQYKTSTNMNKKLIKLTEADLKQIVKKSVNKILKEGILTESNDDVIMSFINPYRPLLSERFFEKVKRSFTQYVQFYGVDQLSEETMEEWLKGRISTMMETEIENRQTPHRNPYLTDSPGRVLTNDYGEYLGTTD